MDDDMMASLDAVEYQPMGAVQQPQQHAMGHDKALDLVFILDCTGSMGSYIASATQNIELIVENILTSGKLATAESLRIGLIAYRDYPPQDNSYITKSFEFTSDVSQVKRDLKTLNASGGGDGPEAVTAGMKAALELQWRPQASKMAVLVADAPAHGIGEYGDGFQQGGPDGEDPLLLARHMATQGISLFVVACEPACSGYQFATDFFRALTVITSAVLVPLTTASLLSHVIVASALEQMDMDRIIQEVGLAVGERVHGGGGDVDDVARELQQKLMLRGESTKQMKFESIHRETDETRHNVETFVHAENLQTAKANLKKIVGSRFTEKYLKSRYGSTTYRGSASSPSLPPRPSASGIPSSTSPPSSPPRKVVSEFKAFSAASKHLSMANTPLGAELDAKDEDDMDDAIELRFSSISLEQAKRITIASAWRTAPPRA